MPAPTLSPLALRRIYLNYNRHYFGGRLPTTVTLKYVKTKAWTAELDYDTMTISISDHLRGWNSWIRASILHEMAHLAAPDGSHGARWQRVMRHLARAGAFDTIW